VYLTAEGRPVTDPELKARVNKLGIPPGWKDVQIAEHPFAHIQACGIDDAGRVQYIYHLEWEKKRTAKKQKRLSALASALPSLRRRVIEDLEAAPGSKALPLAIAVALIDRTGIRVGREKYLEDNGTRGAGTLFSRDVTVRGNELHMTFPAKSGQRAEYTFSDERLAHSITRIKTLPGIRLLVYRHESGKIRPIQTQMINDYLREMTGVEISAKDFRTLHASALAGEALASLEPGTSLTARKKQVAAVVKDVAEFLHNTPAICRSSYISPVLFQLFEKGKLQKLWAHDVPPEEALEPREQHLGQLLSHMG